MEDKKKTAAKATVKSEVELLPANIYAALAQFQSKCPMIRKDATTKVKMKSGGEYTYKYGSLPHVLEQIKPHMAAAGLGFTQPIELLENGGEAIRTILFHVVDDKTIESQIELPDFQFDKMNFMQSKGSVITYLRRYAIMSVLGIVAEDDDNDAQGDGKKVSKKANTGSAQATTTKPVEKPYLNPEPKETWLKAVKYLADGGNIGEIKKKYRLGKNNEERLLNEALTFDDLPFDRQTAEDAEIESTEGIGPDELQGGSGDSQTGRTQHLVR
jgi:hypothetical protein